MTRAGAHALPAARVRAIAGFAPNPWASAALVVAIGFAFAHAVPQSGNLVLADRLARTILARGIPVGVESIGWLGALVIAFASAFGAWPFALGCGIVAASALVLVGRRAARLGAGPAAVLALPLATLCLLDGLRPGADVGAWLFAAVAVMLLDAPTTRGGIAFALISVLWCNLEPAGLIAPALAWLSLATFRGRADLRRRVAIALAATLATLATPAGLAYPRAAFEALRLGDGVRGIVATAPAVVAPSAYHFGFFALLVCALACGSRVALPLAGACVLALANGAFVPLFGIVAAAPVVVAFRSVRYRTIVVPAATLGAIVAIASVIRAPAPVPPEPYDLVSRAASADAPGTLFCAKIDWCDVAFARGARVVMDGRIAPYDARAREDQRTIGGAGRGFREALARSGTTRVLAANDTPLATRLALEPTWRRLASDTQATLFERHGR